MSLSLILVVLLIACAANAVGDVALLWGARQTRWQPGLPALVKTPPRLVLLGSLLGLITIPCWFLIVPLIARLPGWYGLVACISYSAFVAGALAFHLSYAFVGPSLREVPALEGAFKRPLGTLLLYTFAMGAIASIVLALAGASQTIIMHWYHYLLLPTPAIVLIQMIFGSALRSIPFAKIIAGPLAMAAFFIAFTDLVETNSKMFSFAVTRTSEFVAARYLNVSWSDCPIDSTLIICCLA
ncbi:MAG: hypothetical protein AAGI28_05460 [Pseudomonadota bacterium]